MQDMVQRPHLAEHTYGVHVRLHYDCKEGEDVLLGEDPGGGGRMEREEEGGEGASERGGEDEREEGRETREEGYVGMVKKWEESYRSCENRRRGWPHPPQSGVLVGEGVHEPRPEEVTFGLQLLHHHSMPSPGSLPKLPVGILPQLEGHGHLTFLHLRLPLFELHVWGPPHQYS